MRLAFRFFSVFTLASLALGAQAEEKFSFRATAGKLPKNIVPLHYTVHVVPDLQRFRFAGDETIEIEVREPSATIVLNASEIEIASASLSGAGMGTQALQPKLDQEAQTLSFTLTQPLAKGRYTLAINYRGVINRSAEGMYYDRYQVGKDQKIVIGTNLEATDARRFFPSWDEPAFRARFTMSADVPGNFSAVSNMPVATQTSVAGGLKRYTFAPTPAMSTYLVVLAAGELERSTTTRDGTEIGVVTTAGKQAAAQYALASSAQLLGYYNDYFGVRYPLPKLDQIAVPGGFGGAMENWGGIIYNETVMLYDPAKSAPRTKQSAFVVLAHETAHQWFGNLVTMAWWDNLWLNESFASWLEAKATNHFNPEWRVRLSENSNRERAMSIDALKSAHPIYQAIMSESQIAGAFDRITYDKGQAFLLMLENYLGEEPFKQGIRAYIDKHKYSNTTSADLWEALSAASGKPVADIAAQWTTQAGFPLVKVDAVCEGGQRKITLSQQRFLADGSAPDARLWSIPVQINNGTAKPETVLLKERSQSFTRAGCEGALVLDADGVGYYRVAYSPALLAALTRAMPGLPDSARLKTVSDAGVFLSAGTLSLPSYLDLLTALGDEPRDAVWKMVLERLAGFDDLARNEALRPALQRFAIGIAVPKFKQLGWDAKPGEAFEQTQLRTRLGAFLGTLGEPEVLAQARRRFVRFQADPASLAPAMLDVVIGTVGRHADQATFDALLAAARKAEGTEEKARFYGAVFGALDPTLAAQVLPMAMSPEVPPLIASDALAAVAADHPDMAWAYAREHSAALLKLQPDYGRDEFLPRVVSGSSDVATADALEAFVKATMGADAMIPAKRVAELIRVRAQRKARLMPQLQRWLEPKA
ncbi:MAG: M1 family metallopeptidase [Pseudomonadota bacterium]